MEDLKLKTQSMWRINTQSCLFQKNMISEHTKQLQHFTEQRKHLCFIQNALE